MAPPKTRRVGRPKNELETDQTGQSRIQTRFLWRERVPLDKKAEALATYLHEKQWAPKDAQNKKPLIHTRRKIIEQELNVETGDISPTKVEKAQRRLKNNKAPGPGRSVAQLYAWLKDCGQRCLHHALNENW